MAFIELGLSEDEFFSMPPFKTFMMQLANRRKTERAWEQTRFIATMIHNMAGKVSKRQVSPDRLLRLSFDKAQDYPEWTQEDAEELISKWPDIKKN